MPRPKRPRCIASEPAIKGFKPRGAVETGEVILSLEEFEALRLIDYEGMDQSGAAQVMDVSRQTVGRILKAARYKIAESLVTAKRLTVQGGCYEMRGREKAEGGGMDAENHQDLKGDKICQATGVIRPAWQQFNYGDYNHEQRTDPFRKP